MLHLPGDEGNLFSFHWRKYWMRVETVSIDFSLWKLQWMAVESSWMALGLCLWAGNRPALEAISQKFWFRNSIFQGLLSSASTVLFITYRVPPKKCHVSDFWSDRNSGLKFSEDKFQFSYTWLWTFVPVKNLGGMAMF